MRYTKNGKEYDIPETEIDTLVDALEISIDEACEVWIDDKEDNMTEEQKELEAKASKIKRYEKAEKPKERKPKERKVDEVKGSLLNTIAGALADRVTITGRKTETELTFELNGESYTVKLTKHRAKK